MPNQQPRDFSATIKKMLADNERTLEFFAFSLTLMLSMPKDYYPAIAKQCATQAAKNYYDLNFCKDAKTRKSIRKCFEKTLIATLTQDFDIEKAISLIQIHIFTKAFQIRSLNNSTGSKRSFFKKTTNYALTQLHDDVALFSTNFDEEILKDIKTHTQFKYLDFFIQKNSFRKENLFTRIIMPAVFFLTVFTAISICIRQTNNLRLDMMHNEHSKMSIFSFGFLVLSEIVTLCLLLSIGSIIIINQQEKHYDALSKKITGKLIHAINFSLAPAKQETNKHDYPVYHFPLFNLPALLAEKESPSPTFNTRAEPVATQIETDEKFTPRTISAKRRQHQAPAMPAKPASTSNTPLTESIARKKMTYHRIYNHAGLPTHDFIALNEKKLKGEIDQKTLNRFASLLTDKPRIIGGKNENGLTKSELVKHGREQFGLYKLKIKTENKRIHTHAVGNMAHGNEQITLYEADTVKTHNQAKRK